MQHSDCSHLRIKTQIIVKIFVLKKHQIDLCIKIIFSLNNHLLAHLNEL